MFKTKYFAKIEQYKKMEHEQGGVSAVPPFDLANLGGDSNFKRAMREVQRRLFLVAFWFLRAFWPVFRLGPYVIVARHKDVCAVLEDRDTFQVPFGREMEAIIDGAGFALGMDGEAHDTQRRIMEEVLHDVLTDVVVRSDAAKIIKNTQYFTEKLIEGSGGRIDVVRDLMGRVFTETCAKYFGLDLEEPNALLDRALAFSALLFADPTGSADWRQQALTGSVHIRHIVDRAIAKARAGELGKDTIISRLVERAMQNDGSPTDAEIRAIAIGTITGLIPTNTLAAVKILEEILRRRDILKQAKQAAREGRRDVLHDIIFEAARLNPALSPGQWRYAAKDAKIAGKRVPKGSVLMVSTMSAMRDGKRYASPGAFQPGRPENKPESKTTPDLMFGFGTHDCLGRHLAMAQITEIFSILLSQKNIEVTKEPAGWLSYVGPFPRRLDMEFDTSLSPRQQHMITIQAPVRPENLSAIQKKIEALGNPAKHDHGIGKALTATNLVHFASLSAFDAADPDEPDARPDPRLLLELSVDGDPDVALQAIADHAGKELKEIFSLTVGGDQPLVDVLRERRLDLTFIPWQTIGLNFNGTPDCPVGDIAMQAKVADVARKSLDEFVKKKGNPGTRALTALHRVREKVCAESDLRDFLIRPTRRRLAIAEWSGEGTTVGWKSMLSSGAASYFLVLLPMIVLLQSAVIYYFITPPSWPALAVVGVSLAAVGILVRAGVVKDGIQKLTRTWAHIRKGFPYVVLGIGAALVLGVVAAIGYPFAAWTDVELVKRYPDLSQVIRLALSGLAGVAGLAGLGVILWLLWKYARGLVLGLWKLARRLVPATAALGVLVICAYWIATHLDIVMAGLLALTLGIASTLLMLAVLGGIFLAVLRFHESRDTVDERPAPVGNIREIAELENAPGYAQNHIVAVTPMKKGWFRKLTLALALWGIGKLVTYWYRPGFVLNMGTIHYARWFRLPGSDALVFFSNYDGSWESYLEDFVTKAHKGQTAAWGNGKGFPKLRYLILDGAKDGARFKRWVRRQQIPSRFWYSRFPELTTDQIRNNALIHHGLMHAHTDSSAQAWLDCFGTMPRSDATIEAPQVQSLVFRGFPEFSRTSCAAISLPESWDREKVHGWLNMLSYNVWFGEPGGSSDSSPTFIAFSADGLAKLLGELEENRTVMDSFPPAFRIGMGHRAKILRDIGDSTPTNWKWADAKGVAKDERGVDALLFVYAKSAERCAAKIEKYKKKLGAECFVHVIDTQHTEKTLNKYKDERAKYKDEEKYKDEQEQNRKPPKHPREFYEHFGFRDGMSQPVIRGTQKSIKDVAPADLIEAGEMILGYRNSAGFVVPALTMSAEMDNAGDLPANTPELDSRFPRFGAAHVTSLRDFGRNGTFIAVRQLQQHVEDFNAFIEKQAEDLTAGLFGTSDGKPGERRRPVDSLVGCPVDREWVAAKLMGRTRDGQPLLGRSIDKNDNDFDFGVDDPQGLQCPFGAHVRRANPRGGRHPGDPTEIAIMKRHRILRRGRTYENARTNEKGMVFVAICADLENQFEFLQQTWIGSPSFAGLSNEPDPIVSSGQTASASPEGTSGNVFTIPTTAGPITLKNLPRFVTVRGGGYFFMPSRAALTFLASHTKQR
jgi:Dyp-type peroxidase family